MEPTEILPDSVNQLVSFTMDGEEFSFPIHAVQEIVRLPDVTPVPGASTSVEGIINLRGSILPLIDLRRSLGLADTTYCDDSRVIVVRHQGGQTGMIVDRVNEVLQVPREHIAPPPPNLSTPGGSALLGLAKIEGGRRVIMILSQDQLLPPVAEQPKDMNPPSSSSQVTETETRIEDERLLVTFRLADEEFAVNITDVREIVRPGNIVRIPKAPSFVVGIMPLRNELLPVIDLRKRFGLPQPCHDPAERESTPESDARRIVVADINNMTTGLLTDSVSQVLRLPEREVAPVPDITHAEQAAYLQGVGKLRTGDRLLLLLDLAGLLSAEEQTSISQATGNRQATAGEAHMTARQDTEDVRHLVCFRIGDEEFGIGIMQVREIVRVETITAVPGAPSFVSGIVNLRGNILPVINLRKRFGHEDLEHSEQSRILVVELDGKTTGLIVDAVSEVLRIPEKDIEPTPQILTENVASRYVSGVGKLDNGNRTVLLLKTEDLLQRAEIQALPGSGEPAVPEASDGPNTEEVTGHGESPSGRNGQVQSPAKPHRDLVPDQQVENQPA
ncbi:MAG: chemotaxis protein CheW [Acidobacteriota bacterium]|nr:chemotaxis protein CheW [Acidobacteriota bacterium]